MATLSKFKFKLKNKNKQDPNPPRPLPPIPNDNSQCSNLSKKIEELQNVKNKLIDESYKLKELCKKTHNENEPECSEPVYASIPANKGPIYESVINEQGDEGVYEEPVRAVGKKRRTMKKNKNKKSVKKNRNKKKATMKRDLRKKRKSHKKK